MGVQNQEFNVPNLAKLRQQYPLENELWVIGVDFIAKADLKECKLTVYDENKLQPDQTASYAILRSHMNRSQLHVSKSTSRVQQFLALWGISWELH